MALPPPPRHVDTTGPAADRHGVVVSSSSASTEPSTARHGTVVGQHRGASHGFLVRTGLNLAKQIEHFPIQAGVGIGHLAAGFGQDIYDMYGHPLDPNAGHRTADAAKAFAQDVAYLATPGPVIVGRTKTGAPLYRAKLGGTTEDRAQAQTGIANKLAERPLDYILNVLTVGTGAGALVSGAGRAGLLGQAGSELGLPGRIGLRARSGEAFTTPTSANVFTRGIQQGLRSATTGVTGAIEAAAKRELPGIGEHARAVRLGAKQARRAEIAQRARALAPFQRAFRPLTPQEQMAVVLDAKGVTSSELQALVEEQKGLAAAKLKAAKTAGRPLDVEGLAGEIKDHEQMLTALSKVPDTLIASVRTTPKLAKARAAAAQLATKTGDILEAAGKLAPEVRAARPYLTARIAGGARFQPFKAPGPALVRQRATVAALEKQIAQAERKVGKQQFPAAEAQLGGERLGGFTVTPQGALLEPTGTANLRRLRSGLSVERERLAALEQQFAKRKPPKTGPGEFIGGPAIEDLKQRLGDLTYHPEIGPPLRVGQYPQAKAGMVPPTVPGMVKLNRGIRLLTSRWLPSPQAWQDSYIRALAYAHAKARGELAMRIARPLGPQGTAERGWYYIRLGPAKPSRAARERSALSAEMDHFIESGEGDIEGFIKSELASKDQADYERWLAEAKGKPQTIGQISPADYRQLFGDFRGASTFVRLFIDKPTDVWRALTLTYRPAWLVNNFVGQTFLYALNHFTPGGAAAYAKAVLDEIRGPGRYYPEELRYGFFRAEARQAGLAPTRARIAVTGLITAERRMRMKINDINAAISDNVPRRAAWYAVARKHLALINRVERTNLSLDEFLTQLRSSAEGVGSPALRQLHDDIVQQVLDELVDFGNLTVFERRYLRRVFPFYSWIKGIVRASVRLGLHHPATTEILNLLAQQGESVSLAAFGAGAPVLAGNLPLGAPHGNVQTVLGTLGLNPLATVGQAAGGTGSLVGLTSAANENPFLQMNPLIQATIEAATRRDLFTGRPLSSPLGQLGIFAQQAALSPAPLSLAERIISQPVGAAARRKLTVPSTRDLLLSYLGVPIRHKNLAVAAQIAAKQGR